MRLSDEEFAQVEAAAGLAGLTPTGYAGEVTSPRLARRPALPGTERGLSWRLCSVSCSPSGPRWVGTVVAIDADRCAAAVAHLDELVDDGGEPRPSAGR